LASWSTEKGDVDFGESIAAFSGTVLVLISDPQHFVLGCAWMFLLDVFSFNAQNDKAVDVARRLTATIRMVQREAWTSDLDVFIAMT